MQIKVITVSSFKGTNASGKNYDLFRVGALMTTARGEEYVELMLDAKENPRPDVGKSYVPEIEFYPDRNKRLAMSVRGLKVPVAVAQRAG